MATGKKTGGRPKGVPNKDRRGLKEAFQKHEKALVKALLALTKSEDERVQATAIKECLDRGWGKPAQIVAVGGDPDGVPIVFHMHFADGLKPGG